jgi:hypothetical protein
LNASATVVSEANVIFVALGAATGDGMVDIIDTTNPLDPLTYDAPSLPSLCEGGALGTISSTAIGLFCFGSHHSLVLPLPPTNSSEWGGWKTLPETPLTPWSIGSIQPVTSISTSSSSPTLFMASTVDSGAFLFFVEDGNMTLYLCFTNLPCSGTLLFMGDFWFCLTQNEEEAERFNTLATQSSPPLPPPWSED